jgi:hypothetical protein
MSRCDLMRRCAGFCLVMLSIQLLGCGGAPANTEKLVPVAGTVTLDGKPSEGITLMFSPSDNSATRGGWGVTDAQGKFKVTHNAKNQPGLPAGDFTVTYSRFTMADGSPIPAGKPPADVGGIQSLTPVWNDPSKAGPHNKLTIPAEGSPNLELKIDTKLRG